MLNKIKTSVAALAAFSALPFAANASEPVGVDVAVGFDSEYIWRGQDFGDYLGWFDVSTGYAITEELSVTAGLWNANTFDGATDELDFYASTDLSAFGLDFSLGFIYYAFYGDTGTGGISDNIELSLSTAYTLDLGEDYGALDFGLAYIISDAEQSYGSNPDNGASAFTLDIGYAIAGAYVTFTYSLPVDVSLYTPEYWNFAIGYDFELGLATISPYIAYMDGDEDEAGFAGYEGIYYGVSAAFTF